MESPRRRRAALGSLVLGGAVAAAIGAAAYISWRAVGPGTTAATDAADDASARDESPRGILSPRPSREPGPAAGESATAGTEPAAAIAPATRFRGRVLEHADGRSPGRAPKPVAGAMVRLVTADGVTLLETPPDSTGDFRLALADPPPVGFGVIVSAPGFEEFDRRGIYAIGGEHDLGTLYLSRCPVLRGRVVDHAGRPLRARVELRADPKRRRPFVTLIDIVSDLLADPPEIASADTGADGRFTLDAPGTGPFALRARAPGHEDGILEGLEPDLDGSEPEREIRLAPGSTIDGRVTRGDGSPLGGLRVLALLAGDGWPPPDRTYGARTGPDGRYAISGLPLARMSVIVPAPEGAIALSRQVFPPVSGLDIVLEPAAEIAGSVLDGATGLPIPGAQVFGLTQDLSAAIARTDSLGTFTLALARGDGDASIVASAAGYTDRSEALGRLSGPGPFECTILLDRGVELRGTVVRAEDGTPVPRARVLASAGGIGDGASSRAETDDEGGFAITVAPGRVRLLAEGTGDFVPDPLQRPLEIVVESERPPDPVILSLVPSRDVTVRVRTPDGSPAGGAIVIPIGRAPELRARSVRTDRFGIAALDGLAAGDTVTVMAEAADGSLGVSESTTLPPSLEEVVIDVRLAPAQRLEGRVFEAETGRRAANAVVMFEPRHVAGRPELSSERPFLASRTRRGLTDEDGSFELGGLLPGTGDLTVLAPGFPPVRRPSLAVGSDVEVALVAGQVLRGRVSDATDAPLAGSWISIERPDAPPLVLRANEDGTFSTDRAPALPFLLRVSHPGYREQTRHVQSEEMLSEEIWMRLTRWRE